MIEAPQSFEAHLGADRRHLAHPFANLVHWPEECDEGDRDDRQPHG